MGKIYRRQFLIAAGVLVGAPLASFAQQQGKVRRIGYLGTGTAQSSASYLDPFRQGMAELHWVEGRDYVIDARYANNIMETVTGLASELVATQPDLILTTADVTIRPLAQSTKTIPIVFGIAIDPVGLGVAVSLQRPAGNATGLTTLSSDIAGKRLQLLKEAFPRVIHIAVLYVPDDIGSFSQMKEIEEAAPRLKMRVSRIEWRQAADIEPAFKRGEALGVHAYFVTQSYIGNTYRRVIADLLLRSKVPVMGLDERSVEAGYLMTYSPSFLDNFRRAAGYVDKILKGTKPGDLPIEQPTKFALVINMKSAKSMGLKIPQSILLRADRVIE